MSHLDPRTSQCENEVRRIVHLQEIVNRLPDTFNDATKVTKSHVPTINAPTRINVPVRQRLSAKESTIRQKRGRPIGSKDSAPRKRRNERSSSCPPEEARNPLEEEVSPEEARNAPEEVMVKSVLFRIMEVLDETLKALKRHWYRITKRSLYFIIIQEGDGTEMRLSSMTYLHMW